MIMAEIAARRPGDKFFILCKNYSLDSPIYKYFEYKLPNYFIY